MDGPGNQAALLRQRAAGFARFAEWEASHPRTITAAAAVAAVGAIYELLPPAARTRPIDTSGIQRLHAALRHLR